MNRNQQILASNYGGIEHFLSKDNFNRLKNVMDSGDVEAGKYLFWEGDEAKHLYFIRSGLIKLRKSTEEGNDLTFSIMKKGDLLGEYGGYSNILYGYSAEVIEDCELGIIDIRDLETLLYQFGDFAVEFLKWIGLNNRITHSKFRDLLLYGKGGALASTLIRLSNTFGVSSPEGIMIGIKLTNSEIADFIGMTRETVNRLLNTWKNNGTISFYKSRIVIRCIDDLRRICNCPTCPACPKEICRI